jgi:branched-chain amino acid transport system substrate-binding protein
MSRLLMIAVATSLLVAAGCTGSGGSTQTIRPLHIGVDLPLTGVEGPAANPALDGIRFYVQQHPTLDGFAVSLRTADDAAGGMPNPDQGVRNVESFLGDPSLVAMIGPFNSSVARKEIPVANAAGLAMVSPATSNPCLTRDIYLPLLLNPMRTAITCQEAHLPSASSLRPTHLNNYFRLSTTDELQGPAAADYVFNTLHLLKAAVITGREAYGQSLAAAFASRLERLGGTVVGTKQLDAGSSDVSAFLSMVKSEGAQAVYFGGTTADGGCSIRAQMGAIFPEGEATPFLSGDGVADDPACVGAAGGNSAGVYATVPFVDATTLAAAQPTIAAFKTAFGSTSAYGPYTMLSYDAAAVVYAALDRTIRASGGQLPVRGNVVSQLSVAGKLDGVTGPIAFDAAGDTTNRIVSLFEPTGSDPSVPWKLVTTIDYTAGLPY